VTFYHGKGCAACNNSGYRGRIGLFEILVMHGDIQKMIYQAVSSSQIKQRAREIGMRTLREDGIQKVFAGWTTFEEVLRASQSDNAL
jgi:type IV pilus assembly protein PilB